MKGRKNIPSEACEGSFCLFSSPGLQAGVNGGVYLQAASAALSLRLQPLPEPMAKAPFEKPLKRAPNNCAILPPSPEGLG